MKIKSVATVALACLLGTIGYTISWAEQVQEQKIAIVLDLGDEAGVLAMDFSPFDLAEGETRSVTSEDGRTHMLVKRDGDVILTTDQGKEILLPAPSAEGMTRVDDGANTVNVEVFMDQPIDGLMISSAAPLDEATRERIRQALKSAGIDQSVRFTEQGKHNIFIQKNGADDEAGEIRIIREKRVIEEQDKP
jgi:hypothetical protein